MERVIQHGAHGGLDEMKALACETASALNRFPGQCGYCPSLWLFGQEMGLPGECWREGKAA
eukprot:1713996-Pyramimonas_sp.AAC.1